MALFKPRAKAHDEQAMREETEFVAEPQIALPYDLRDELSWVDFSTPSNPMGMPSSFVREIADAISKGELSNRPDGECYAMRSALSHYFEISPESILCGTSTFQMIRTAAQAFQPVTVGVSIPCPVEYHLALSNAGHQVASFSNPFSFATSEYAMAAESTGGFSAAMLANPAYPTSRLLDRHILKEYLEKCLWVIVDESYLELSLAGESYIPLTQRYENLVVIRNLSMSFAMPGTPNAYLVAHPKTIEHIKRFYDASEISLIGDTIAHLLMSQLPYLDKTHEVLEAEIPWLQTMLSLVPGVRIFPSEGNFVLCSFSCDKGMKLGVQTAAELVARLQVAGFTVPLMDNVVGLNGKDYFCIAARQRSENHALIAAIRNIVSGRDLDAEDDF